ncbi:hypothetical protein WAE61_00005 [Comamonadaceae bacterium PP-2]
MSRSSSSDSGYGSTNSAPERRRLTDPSQPIDLAETPLPQRNTVADASPVDGPLSPSFLDRNIAVFNEIARLNVGQKDLSPLVTAFGGSIGDRAGSTAKKLHALKNSLEASLRPGSDDGGDAMLIRNANVEATRIIADGHARLESAARWSKALTFGADTRERKGRLESLRLAEKKAYQNSQTNHQVARVTRELSEILKYSPPDFKDKRLVMPGGGVSESNSIAASAVARLGFGGSSSSSFEGMTVPQFHSAMGLRAAADVRAGMAYKRTTELARTNDGNFMMSKMGVIGGNLSAGGQVGLGVDIPKLPLLAKSLDVGLGASAALRIEGGATRQIDQHATLNSTPADAHGVLLLVNMVEPSGSESASSKPYKDSGLTGFLVSPSRLDTGALAGVTQRRLQRGYDNEAHILDAYARAGVGGKAFESLYGGSRPLAVQFMPESAQAKPDSMAMLPKLLPKPLWITRDQNSKVVYGKVSGQGQFKLGVPLLSYSVDMEAMRSKTWTHRTTESAKLPHNAFDPALTGSVDLSAKYIREYTEASQNLMKVVARPLAQALGVETHDIANAMMQMGTARGRHLPLGPDSGKNAVALHRDLMDAVNRINRFAVQNDKAIKRASLPQVRTAIKKLNEYGFGLSFSDSELMGMTGSNSRTKTTTADRDIAMAVATIEEVYSAIAGALKVRALLDDAGKENAPDAPLKVSAPRETGTVQKPAETDLASTAALDALAHPPVSKPKPLDEQVAKMLYDELDAETLPFHRLTLVKNSGFRRGFDNREHGQTTTTTVKSANSGASMPNAFGESLAMPPKFGDNFVPLVGGPKYLSGSGLQKTKQVTTTPFDYTDPGQTGITTVKRYNKTTYSVRPDTSQGPKAVVQALFRSLTGGWDYTSDYGQSKWQQYSSADQGRKFLAYEARGQQVESQKRMALNFSVPIAPGLSVGGGVTANSMATATRFDHMVYGNDVGARAILTKKLFKEWFAVEEIGPGRNSIAPDLAVSKFQALLGDDAQTAKLFLGADGVDPISSQLSQMRNLMLDNPLGQYDPPFEGGVARLPSLAHEPVHTSDGEIRPAYENADAYIDKSGFLGYMLNNAPVTLSRLAVKTWLDKKQGMLLPRAADIDALLSGPPPKEAGPEAKTLQQFLKQASLAQRLAFYRSPEGEGLVRNFLIAMDFAGHFNDFVVANNTYRYMVKDDVRKQQDKLLQSPASSR